MLMKNFPSSINENSSQQDVRDYLKSVSNNERVKKPSVSCCYFHEVSRAYERRAHEYCRKFYE